MSKPGRKDYEPTDAQRQTVQVLTANGVSQRIIARSLTIDGNTLRKHFRVELDEGHDQVVAAMGAALVRAGLHGNVNAQRYWLATHGGPEWRMTERREIGGIEGAPPIALDAEAKVVVFLPDNGRDKPEGG